MWPLFWSVLCLTTLPNLPTVSQEVVGANAKKVDPLESLKATVQAFHSSLGGKDVNEISQQCVAILPRTEDVVALFGTDYKEFGELVSLASKRYLLKAQKELLSRPDTALAPSHAQIADYRFSDQRADVSKIYSRVLPLIPKDVLVYRATSLDKEGRSLGGSGPYIFVNGRWVWFLGFDSVEDVKRQDIKKLLLTAKEQVAALETEVDSLREKSDQTIKSPNELPPRG